MEDILKKYPQNPLVKKLPSLEELKTILNKKNTVFYNPFTNLVSPQIQNVLSGNNNESNSAGQNSLNKNMNNIPFIPIIPVLPKKRGKNEPIVWQSIPEQTVPIGLSPKETNSSRLMPTSTQAIQDGERDAKKFLDNLLEKGIVGNTPLTDLKKEKENAIDNENNKINWLSAADWGLAVANAWENSMQDFGPQGVEIFPELFGADLVARTLANRFGPDPSLSDQSIAAHNDNLNSINDKYDNAISAMENSDDKYKIYGGNDIYDDAWGLFGIKTTIGPKNKFRDSIMKRIEDYNEKEPNYGTEAENGQYKRAYIEYLKKIYKRQ